MASAAAILLSLTPSSSDPQPHPQGSRPLPTFFTSRPCLRQQHPSFSLPKTQRFTPKSSSDSPTTASASSSPSATYSYLEDSFKTGRFLSNEELEKLKTLQDYKFHTKLRTGSMWVRVMRPEEMDITVKLLAESFAESMLLPVGYLSLLRFLVKQYLIERRAVLPYAVTLIAFYRGNEESDDGDGGGDGDGEDGEEEELAGTVEVCFDKRGANASPPSPSPPKNSPYICNMTVKETLRRRGIGWNLLKASEELISQMSSIREVYLHCRMIDSAPFDMYIKAGYNVVKTDSILVLLMLQRRKHLMCKKLPVLSNPSEINISGSDTELTSKLDLQKS